MNTKASRSIDITKSSPYITEKSVREYVSRFSFLISKRASWGERHVLYLLELNLLAHDPAEEVQHIDCILASDELYNEVHRLPARCHSKCRIYQHYKVSRESRR